ncbi:MAG: hypothetical protein HOP12_03770 [Candidatus Eisenbacteria bacterium]|uniref:T9SS type A sorting domain-containing protein n=1 Tax=Eiseniibacteriota bacterium TaxID=2212470 RepID=A0A849SVS6_UNCEI|nr:hypothetical protein [Candidatus Eisenbacteria bacterium]
MPTLRSFSAALLLFGGALMVGASPIVAADWVVTSLPSGYHYRLAVGLNGMVYACGGSQLHVSADDGVTWTPGGVIAPNTLPQALVCSPSGALYAGDFAVGVFCSDDACATWLGVELPQATHSFSTGCFAFGTGGEVYAGTIDGVYRSSDLGLTWEARSTGLLGRHVRTMAVTADQRVFVHTLYPAQIDGLYRSTDRGDTWVRLGGNAPYFSALIAAPNGDLLGTSDESVFRSTDGGVVWSSSGSGLGANENLTSIVITPTGRMIAGGYRVDRSDAGVLDAGDGPTRSSAHVLRQNSPNPFPRSTRIGFTLARSARVDLAVFDLTGRHVATLAEGVHEPGEHAVMFDGSVLPAGAYLYRFVADGVTTSRRMILMR